MTVKRMFINVHAFVVTGLIIGIMLFLVWLPVNADFLNLFSETLGDFDVSDVILSQLHDVHEPDTSIVLVNIAHLPKQLIASQIERLSAFHPKVIGLDVFPLVPNPYNPEYDSLFMATLRRNPNVVLASKLSDWNKAMGRYESLYKAPAQFSTLAQSGYVNLIVDDNKPYRVVRECSMRERAGDSIELSFAAKLALLSYPSEHKYLLERDNKKEIINYRGNIRSFYTLESSDVLDSSFDLAIVHNKIVLMGYLGEDISQPTQATEDRFFTPLNERYIGKADRDMFGVVIHANIVSMIIHKNYIDEMPLWLSYGIAFLFCYFYVVFLEYMNERFSRFYEVVSLGSQLFLGISLLFLTLGAFSYFRYDANLSLVLLIVAIAPNAVEIYLTFVPSVLKELHHRISRSHLQS